MMSFVIPDALPAPHRRRVEINLSGASTGTVRVDGKQLEDMVAGVEIEARAGEIPRVRLEMTGSGGAILNLDGAEVTIMDRAPRQLELPPIASDLDIQQWRRRNVLPAPRVDFIQAAQRAAAAVDRFREVLEGGVEEPLKPGDRVQIRAIERSGFPGGRGRIVGPDRNTPGFRVLLDPDVEWPIRNPGFNASSFTKIPE